MFDHTSLSAPFIAKDKNTYKLVEYQASEEFLRAHFAILNSGQSSYLSYQRNSFEDLIAWVDDVHQSSDQFLFAIIDSSSNRLVGTSKVSFDYDSSSFSIGIMLDEASAVGINIDRIVKGALLNQCFSAYPHFTCKGICQSKNIKSISFYKYFKFSIDKSLNGDCTSDLVSFSLSKEIFYSRMGELSSSLLTKSGFDIAQFDVTNIFTEKFIDLPGYSSLSYFNLISMALDLGDHINIVDLYDLDSLSSLSLHLGTSYFSLL